jgi:hypothetical protein
MSDIIDLGKEVLKTNNSVVGFIAGLGLVGWLMFKKVFYPKTEVDLMIKVGSLESAVEHLKSDNARLQKELLDEQTQNQALTQKLEAKG